MKSAESSEHPVPVTTEDGHQRDRKGNPLAMSFNIKDNPNEIPSMHTLMKEQKKIMRFLDTIHQQFQAEADLCSQDESNLSQGLQGILDYEKAQMAAIDSHYQSIWQELEKMRDATKDDLKDKIRLLKDRQ